MDKSEGCESNQVPLEKHNNQKGTEITIDLEPERNDQETKPNGNTEKIDKHRKHEFAVPALPAFTKPTSKKRTVEQPEKVNNLKDNSNTVSVDSMKLLENVIDIKTDGNTLNNTSLEKSNTLNDTPTSESNTPNNLPITKEKTKDKKCEFPYHVPNWGGVPSEHTKYSLTVLKDGTIKDNIDLSGKSVLTFGRLADACDVLVEHPSCSRYHAVLQYCTEEKDIRKVGYYLYDLGSTHGSYVNKEKVKAKVYVRVRVGYQIKFGGSSRLYIVEGPEEDQEEEIDMEEVRQMRLQHKQKMAEEKQSKTSSHQKGATNDDDGATWGFGEDAQEEELDLQDLMEKKNNFQVKDPKKTLNGFFESEGMEFEYEMCERGRGNSVIHVAQVRLPIESSFGVEVIAEGTSSNKKDAVLNCATDACKLLQAYDVMRNTCKEDQRLKRQRELEANDFYDSDDDNYLDRTGSVEKKRLKRKQWAGKVEKQETETHESLKAKVEEKMKMLFTLEEKLNLSIAASKKEDDDSLDAFMSSMKSKLDKKSESKIKRQITELKKDIEKLKKLVEKTQPALPTFTMEKEKQSVIGDKLLLKDTPDSTVKSMNNSHSINVDPNSVNQKEQTEIASEKEPTSSPKKKKRIYGAAMMPTKKKDTKKKIEAEFIEWIPPKNQTGDGRTHLNDKLGY